MKNNLLECDMGASFSPCRTWRYALWRIWDAPKGMVAFIGLNPSTADETTNDPTVRRCINFANDWGYGGLWMLNLFAYRATDPREMKAFAAPVGPDNNHVLTAVSHQAIITVAAWGVHGSFDGRDKFALEQLLDRNRLKCLGKTKDGHPKHPLYLPKNATLIPM